MGSKNATIQSADNAHCADVLACGVEPWYSGLWPHVVQASRVMIGRVFQTITVCTSQIIRIAQRGADVNVLNCALGLGIIAVQPVQQFIFEGFFEGGVIFVVSLPALRLVARVVLFKPVRVRRGNDFARALSWEPFVESGVLKERGQSEIPAKEKRVQ
jgi:hypothetical protein